MAVVHQTFTTASGTSASITFAAPTGIAAGDVLISSFYHANAITAAPAGWTRFVDGDAGGFPTRHSAYWKIATGSEPASYTWTQSSAQWRGGISRFSGVSNTTPIDIAASSAISLDATTVVLGPITTASANAMVLGSVSGTATTPTVTPPGALTERWDANGVELASAIQPGAGSTGSLTWTYTPSGTASGGWLSALRESNPAQTVSSPGFISSTAQVFAPQVTSGQTIVANFIPSGSQVFTPAVRVNTNIAPAQIAAGSQVFAPTVIVPGMVAPNFVASSAQVFQPSITSAVMTSPPRTRVTHQKAVNVVVDHEPVS